MSTLVIDPSAPLEDLCESSGISRSVLVARIAALVQLAKAQDANLSRVQDECSALLEELRAYRASGLCLPGWWCRECGAFNGSAKKVRRECRCCGEPRPG